jgi:hypothetical protein
MADSVALPDRTSQAVPISIPGRFFRLLPGVLLLAAVGYGKRTPIPSSH